MIEGDIRREMTVDTYQKYQYKFEAAANMPLLTETKRSDK